MRGRQGTRGTKETGMAGVIGNVRRGQAMNDARLAASPHRARKARGAAPRNSAPAYPRLAGSGLEPLESRLMMSAVRMDAEFTVNNLGLGDDRSTTSAQSLGFATAINFY